VVKPVPAIGTEFRVHEYVVFPVVPAAQDTARLTEPPALVSGLGLVDEVAKQPVGAPGAVPPLWQFSE
jgi:hypothetical protein